MESRFSLALKLLLHDLNIPYEKSTLFQKNPSFHNFSLFSPGESWNNTHLTVGMLSDILPVANIRPHNYFLCIRDRFADVEETTHQHNNLVVLTTNKKLPAVFNKIISIFYRYRKWYSDMNLSAATNQGIQPLVDLTEDIIGNHIHVLDASFKLMGYTHHIELDNQITQDLLLHGYHSDETMEKFLELRRFEQFEQEKEIIVSDDCNLCKYVTLKRVFHHNGKPVMYVFMHCNHRKADDSLLDLFQMFLQFAEHYAKMENLHPSVFAASTQYLQNLLDGSIQNMDEAIFRASYATIPFQQDYQLYAIFFEDHFNTPLDRLADDINHNLPFSYVVVYHRRIVILYNWKNKNDTFNAIAPILQNLLQRYPCTIGISNHFPNLWGARNALEQAGCAIEYGARKRHSAYSGKDAPVRFYAFEESLLTLLVTKSCISSPELFKNCFLFQSINTLRKHDNKHNSSLLQTLETYLTCNQKATVTSQRLHMHRNTVLYHIERIEQLLGVSLEDPETSIKLYLGIKTWKANMIDLI